MILNRLKIVFWFALIVLLSAKAANQALECVIPDELTDDLDTAPALSLTTARLERHGVEQVNVPPLSHASVEKILRTLVANKRGGRMGLGISNGKIRPNSQFSTSEDIAAMRELETYLEEVIKESQVLLKKSASQLDSLSKLYFR